MATVHVDVREFQRTLNRFTSKYLRHVGDIKVDGVIGHSTAKQVRLVRHMLGYGEPLRGAVKVTPELVRRMRHPHSPRYSTPAMLVRGANRRRHQRKHAKAPVLKAIVYVDGKPVDRQIAEQLTIARKHGWTGRVVSGYRTPAYSESLCYGMCGAPSCSGTCAGKRSGHSQLNGAGCVDVTDYTRLLTLCNQRSDLWITNDLPRDRVHFSRTGH